MALGAWTARRGLASLRPGGNAGAARLHDPARHDATARYRSDGSGVPEDVRRVDRRGESVLPTAPRMTAGPRLILFVCHANTARSVMAHVMLERMLRERG